MVCLLYSVTRFLCDSYSCSKRDELKKAANTIDRTWKETVFVDWKLQIHRSTKTGELAYNGQRMRARVIDSSEPKDRERTKKHSRFVTDNYIDWRRRVARVIMLLCVRSRWPARTLYTDRWPHRRRAARSNYYLPTFFILSIRAW